MHGQRNIKTYGYIHTLRIRNTYCSSAAAMVARTHLNITRKLPVLFNFPLSVIIGPVPCIYSLVIWLMDGGSITTAVLQRQGHTPSTKGKEKVAKALRSVGGPLLYPSLNNCR